MELRRFIANRRALAGVTAAVLMASTAVVSFVFSAGAGAATSSAADKMVVQGTNGLALCSTSVPVSVSLTTNCNEGPTALLSGTIKLSSPKNLVVEVTLDCSTVTDVTTTTTSSGGNKNTSSAEAAAGVHAWLTLTPAGQTPDPTKNIIPIDPGGATNASQLNVGDVTFCDRDIFLSQSLTNTDSTGAVTLATTLNIASQDANGFNWVSLPDANTTQVETVTLWGETADTGNVSGNATEGAAAWVGQRTMILTPANTAQNAEF